ncbi:acyl-CoA thioesterase [Solimonas soli]|uniref:acyl-CoA thioesterase n=1 Tax=Solimonas soli TaxID=413479 RepID=UPI0004878D7A|nr:acyl-CoA thioesterase [Solimonas soli]
MNQPEKSLIMTVLMTSDMANFSGNVHGGRILSLLDNVAYACATRYSRRYVVTLSVDQMFFKEPIHVGDLVTFKASINYTGRTSMEVGIRVEAEHILTGISRHTNTCYFTMIAMDDRKKPAEVPALLIETEDERRRYREAEARRQQRKISAGDGGIRATKEAA